MKAIFIIFFSLFSAGCFAQTPMSKLIRKKNITEDCFLNDLTWPTRTNMTNTSGTWSKTAYPGGSYAREDMAFQTTLGIGWIQAEWSSSTNSQIAIILDPSNSIAVEYYATCDYGLYVDNATGEYSTAIDGSYTNRGIAAAAGDLFRLKVEYVTGTGTVTAQYYRGGNWIDIHVFAATTTSPLYLMCSYADPGFTNELKNPKQCGLEL